MAQPLRPGRLDVDTTDTPYWWGAAPPPPDTSGSLKRRADVVIVNPTHFAVALAWARTPGTAPVVVAKGADETARRIREVALASQVPVLSDPPTARALYREARVGSEIAPAHYRAVAAAIRFADMLKRKRRARGAS